MIFDMLKEAREIWNKYEMGFYASILGSFGMGTIHLVSLIMNFSWITFNYMLLCYVFLFARVFLYFVMKNREPRFHYLSGALWLMVVLIPLGVSLYKTITDRDAPVYFFEWIIYLYALYAFIKISVAIYNLAKCKGRGKLSVLPTLSLINALFTMFMMEFAMIRTVEEGQVTQGLFILETTLQGFIILATLGAIVGFLVRFVVDTRKAHKE